PRRNATGGESRPPALARLLLSGGGAVPLSQGRLPHRRDPHHLRGSPRRGVEGRSARGGPEHGRHSLARTAGDVRVRMTEGLLKNPAPQPLPRSGEGAKRSLAPPLRFGEGVGGRGFSSVTTGRGARGTPAAAIAATASSRRTDSNTL